MPRVPLPTRFGLKLEPRQDAASGPGGISRHNRSADAWLGPSQPVESQPLSVATTMPRPMPNSPDPAGYGFLMAPEGDSEKRDPMRKVIVQEFTTIDGFAADRTGRSTSSAVRGDRSNCRRARRGSAPVPRHHRYDPARCGHLPHVRGVLAEPDDRHRADRGRLERDAEGVFSRRIETAPWGTWEPARVVSGSAIEESIASSRDAGRTWSSGAACRSPNH